MLDELKVKREAWNRGSGGTLANECCSIISGSVARSTNRYTTQKAETGGVCICADLSSCTRLKYFARLGI